MTNEQIVAKIKNGFSVTDNMQLLYESNLPLIKQYVKPYSAFEPMEDLLQESYFGLSEAVKHYESAENVKFMTYAGFWIVQAVRHYLKKCGSTVRIPSYTRQKMTHCRRAIEQIEQEQGREPTIEEIAALMGVSEKEVQEIKSYMQGVASLDTPISDDGSLTLSDTLQADLSVENETIDKMYAEHSKNELWGTVERYTMERENHIIREIFINNQSMSAVAKTEGISLNRVRQIKETGLRKLRFGKARRELLEKFDVVESKLYKGTLKNFREHENTSIVEYIALRRIEAEKRYKRHLAEIEEMQQKRGCSKTERPAYGSSY